MVMKKKPAGLIPEPLRGSEPDSFAHYTITVRFPRIIKQVLQENDLTVEEQKSLEELSAEIPEKPLRSLLDQNSPDARNWSEYLLPYAGQNWLQTPWFICETYFFRRIIEAIRYYEKSPEERPDPYRRQKESSLDETLANLRAPIRQISLKTAANLRSALSEALFMGVWGNQTDLSMWPAGSNQGPDQVEGQDASHLLVNEANLIFDHLMNEGSTRVDLILDNAAAELSHDLLLVDLLISSPLEAYVHLHVKPHPTYVSDATAHDVHMTVDALTKMKQRSLRAVGKRLAESLLNGCLQIHEDYYWTSPLSGWQMPDKLYNDLAKAQLIISKGDANYRRFLGDRHWPFTTPFAEITHYRPAPLAALRVLKSDVVCGLKQEQPALMRQKDPNWMINGRWGVIQFAY
jgi:uncharacterized protein with ATP-grasp and redox domains